MRQVNAAVLNYFSDIVIQREDSATGQTQKVKVESMFGQCTKSWMFRKELDSGSRSYPVMPSITLQFTGHTYAQGRAAAVNEARNLFSDRIGDPELAGKMWQDLEPAPYDYSYACQILCRHPDDQCQIMEQILPYFNPGVMLRVYEISFLKIERDLPMHMNSITYDNEKDLSPEARDTVYNASFNLTVNGYMYKPVREGSVIKKIGFAARDEGAVLHHLLNVDELPPEARDWGKREGKDDFWHETGNMSPIGEIKPEPFPALPKPDGLMKFEDSSL